MILVMFIIDPPHSWRNGRKILLNPKPLSMSVLIVLVIVSVIVAGCFLAAFIWSVKKGQYDDDYAPSVRILFDDTVSTENKNPN